MSFVTTFLAPSHNLFKEGAILVNKAGERFCDELDRPQDSISGQEDGVSYILFDDTIAQKFNSWPNFVSTAPGVGYAYLPDYRRSRRDICLAADSLAGLADKLGIDAGALARTVEAHSATATSRPVLTQPPFHALGPAKAWIMFSEGGLRVDERLRVLDAERRPIPGLFAAGSAGQGGVILEGHGHHLAWAFTSGRLAGRHAALGD